MPKVVWTPTAEKDLEDILYYIRVQGGQPMTARRNGETILDAVAELAAQEFPRHQHPAAPEGWFYLQRKRWLVFYCLVGDNIEVMRVVDAARDLPSVLGS
jgi:plasmid stabilization system protein ParE